MKNMNHNTRLLLSLLAAAWLPLPAMAETKSSTAADNASAEARADANATATGNETKTSTNKQTVTVTSDGKRTTKRTVTVRDGKEEVITETTDENGKTTVDRGDGANGGPNQEPGPAAAQDGPWLGLRVTAAPAALRDQLDLAEDEGVLVDVVAPDGPAAQAGLKVNDLLLKLADRKLGTPQDLRDALNGHQAGETVKIEVLSKGKRSTVEVTLGERPADKGVQEPPQDAKDLLERARKMLNNQPGNGKVEVEVSGSAAGLDALLNNPNVPEDFKKAVREMRQQMLDFEKQHEPK
jgi:membrane-associated protease RseP (regulator of RpoE activity)